MAKSKTVSAQPTLDPAETPPESPQEPADGVAVPDPALDGAEGRSEPQEGAEQNFPLNSFRDAARELRRPFTSAAIKFKVQSDMGGKGALVVAYIDARLVVERLNLIVPHLWRDEYKPLDGQHLLCKLTVDDIPRYDVGQGTGKAAYSDALKRAAVKFGVGVSLYAIPQVTLWLSENGKWIEKRGKTGKESVVLTPAGDSALRRGYEKWLIETGVPKFGRPLDHGDIEQSVGDLDVEPPDESDDEPIYELLETEEAEALREEARAAYKRYRDAGGKGMLPGAFNVGLRTNGHSIEALQGFVKQVQELEAPVAEEVA